MDKFLKIAITEPDPLPDEATLIERLIDGGIDYVHIRKPQASARDIKNLIENIHYPFRRRLKLHGHFDLLNEFNLGGAHINSRCPVAPSSAINVSRSCHTLEELDECKKYEYVTLSPIFDSISKQGYRSAFDLQDLSGKIKGKNVIALGGVVPEKFSILQECGFAGAAMLGCVWKDIDTFLKKINNHLNY